MSVLGNIKWGEIKNKFEVRDWDYTFKSTKVVYSYLPIFFTGI